MMYKTMSIHQTRPFTKRAIAVAALNALGGLVSSSDPPFSDASAVSVETILHY